MLKILVILPIYISFVFAADGDPCQYNDLTGFCVTVDQDRHNAQCHSAHGWLQFYMGVPLPRLYEGCGDDGIVKNPQENSGVDDKHACCLSAQCTDNGNGHSWCVTTDSYCSDNLWDYDATQCPNMPISTPQGLVKSLMGRCRMLRSLCLVGAGQ